MVVKGLGEFGAACNRFAEEIEPEGGVLGDPTCISLDRETVLLAQARCGGLDHRILRAVPALATGRWNRPVQPDELSLDDRHIDAALHFGEGHSHLTCSLERDFSVLVSTSDAQARQRDVRRKAEKRGRSHPAGHFLCFPFGA